MDNKNTKPNSFDVFLCHNSDDKAEIRHIADELIKQGIKPWLDEREIPPGTLWQTALEEQIANINSAAVFVGKSGIGPWQDIEIRAFINEFVERKCPVIPAILPTTEKIPSLPILLKNLHYVDFREPDPDPWLQIQWGITGNKPDSQTSSNSEPSDKAELLPEKEKQLIELRLPGNLDDFSNEHKEELLAALSALLKIGGGIKITESKPGSVRVFLELTPEQADKIYAAAKNGKLDNLGITEARLYPSLADPPNAEERTQLLILLNHVKENWIDGVLKQSLYHQTLISLGKHAMDDAVETPWNNTVNLPKQRQQLHLDDTQIDTVFDATGLLLILGEPGSGKTITLLELASLLIKRAAVDSKERIPVVLNLSSWQKSQSLVEWIADKMRSAYQVPSKLARTWLDQGYIVPLLDGLDEVRTENQPNCVEAINKYIDEFHPSGLVVCSRLKEYQWLPERLKMNGAICIEPLNQQQIDSYFAALGDELKSLRMAIQEDTALQELAQSPLMLNIMSMAYQSADSESLVEKELPVETRRTKIFDAYVEKMFQRKESTNQIFPKEKVKLWLSWLAKKMQEQSQSVLFVENIQPSWLDNWKQRFAYGAILSLNIGLFLGLFFFLLGLLISLPDTTINDVRLVGKLKAGLVLGFLIGLFARSSSSTLNGIICALITGLVSFYSPEGLLGNGSASGAVFIGFAVGLITSSLGPLNNIKATEELSWMADAFFNNLKIYLLINILFWGSLAEFTSDSGLMGVFLGFFFGIVTGISGGYIEKIKTDKNTPNQGIILSIKNSILTGLVALITFISAYSLLFIFIAFYLKRTTAEIFTSGNTVLATGPLVTGLYIASVMTFKHGLGSALKHYTLRLVLWCNGKTPLKFIPCLDHCAKLILLKKVGGGYIFIHRMLLEYFAKLEPTNSKSTKV
ncbi:TIR domain-containing protein [Nitrosomonas sp.]|uniref:TIR domain-containing protein n=1 Tax=Nitrosomonas sp. TaxID=42353 RepID=UPI002639D35D|nr:TIR domain-containing protein [Nitrosomonas sp.]